MDNPAEYHKYSLASRVITQLFKRKPRNLVAFLLKDRSLHVIASEVEISEVPDNATSGIGLILPIKRPLGFHSFDLKK